jgi:hypothetical protein
MPIGIAELIIGLAALLVGLMYGYWKFDRKEGVAAWLSRVIAGTPNSICSGCKYQGGCYNGRPEHCAARRLFQVLGQ